MVPSQTNVLPKQTAPQTPLPQFPNCQKLLLQLLHPESETRRLATRKLRQLRINHPTIKRALRNALLDSDPFVVLGAAIALADLKDHTRLLQEALRELLQSPMPGLKHWARYLLQRIQTYQQAMRPSSLCHIPQINSSYCQ